jgi:hypothetical protein
MDEIRVPAHELENILFGPGYTLTGVTFDGDAQTITLHARRGGSVYNTPPISAASALNGRGAPAGAKLAGARFENRTLILTLA